MLPSLSQHQLENIEAYTKSFPDNTQLSIAILNDSITDYFGIIKTEDSLLIVNNKDSVFEIGSISKLFTSVMLANLILNDQASLDDPVNRFFPLSLENVDREYDLITFRTLANHTSGLPRMPDNYEFPTDSGHSNRAYSIEAMHDYLENDLSLISTPGKDYNYSNLGYGLLGYVISNILKEDYESLLQNLICKPYELKSSTTIIEEISNLLVLGKDQNGEIIENHDLGILTPSGGVFSNTLDLANLLVLISEMITY